VTTLSESRVPSDPDGRGPATPPPAQLEPAQPQPEPMPQIPVQKGRKTGSVYSSKHAIRSLIRSETETSAIKWQPRAEDSGEQTNPEPPAAPKPVAMAATRTNAVAQDPLEVSAPVAPSQGGPSPRVRKKLLMVLPLVVALLMAFVVAVGYLAFREPAPTNALGRWAAPAVPLVPTGPETATDPLANGVPDPFHTQKLALGGAPTRLKVKSIGVDTPLETLRLGAAGELDPPDDFAKAGWYAGGTVPGDIGPAVIAGHVDNKSGPAVFYKLRELAEGDRIEVVRDGRTVRFTVSSTAWYPKNAFPTAKVYGPTPDSQLRLITCGGVFNHKLRSYTDNLVVYAVLG
jgi:hypothetical protein